MNEWISVKNRMPEPYIDVFVYPYKDFTCGEGRIATWDSCANLFEVRCEDSHQVWFEEVEPTHWMPLPEPPVKHWMPLPEPPVKASK